VIIYQLTFFSSGLPSRKRTNMLSIQKSAVWTCTVFSVFRTDADPCLCTATSVTKRVQILIQFPSSSNHHVQMFMIAPARLANVFYTRRQVSRLFVYSGFPYLSTRPFPSYVLYFLNTYRPLSSSNTNLPIFTPLSSTRYLGWPSE